MGSGDQLGLFDPLPGVPRQRAGSDRWQRYRPTLRRLCHDCTADIHARGPAVAPLPRTVRWRRGELLVCDLHKIERGTDGH